ncbi:hypothetical protein BO78DRAFT_13904 [Aspergillus sclerotiicarbonarius CBS 121057]|uniref:Uncharacterized protein n=1 Tax=Aspergillus sclerotiicarbonarius (strain CBS 121057 / IBT 28362) TaxID=1448318 RepID=A0A319EYI3_ASPSB|nr:hypothetical protein BO78DRAFT_13904 [Aspergillus sclerotiicarbonarius CBS 121057]
MKKGSSPAKGPKGVEEEERVGVERSKEREEEEEEERREGAPRGGGKKGRPAVDKRKGTRGFTTRGSQGARGSSNEGLFFKVRKFTQNPQTIMMVPRRRREEEGGRRRRGGEEEEEEEAEEED